MAFCGKCGTQLSDGVRFCPSCGAEVQGAASAQNGAGNQQGTPVNNAVNSFTNTADSTSQYSAEDINANKGMAILSYLSWLLLIPLFAAKTSPFAKFHVNQGLVLAIIETAWWIVQAILSAIFYNIFFWNLFGMYTLIKTILSLVNLLFLALAIVGIVNAANGKAKDLPVIGKIRIYK